jgi:outer membrane protein OmpA-like peptidoglycan-associated protein
MFLGSFANGQANVCSDAASIFYNGEFNIAFTDKKGNDLETAYPSLKDKTSENQLWCSYLASEDGELNFSASLPEGSLRMVIFKEEVNDICGEISRGLAEIERLQIEPQKSIGLSQQTGEGKLFSLRIKEGRKIHVVFFADQGVKDKLKLDWSFLPSGVAPADTKTIDFREDEFTPSIHIKLLDGQTKRALIGRLSIDGHKKLAAQYIGSDFYFSVGRKCKLSLNAEVEGYFFNDIIVEVPGTENKEFIIELERATSGKSIQLEEIQFNRGTSEITESSFPKLKRLKDFLILNADLQIEIQGHVHAKGDNKREYDKLSEARAKRVMKYLTESGVEKERLTIIGYGNTKPVYPEAKFSHEEQANRRVEILVK